MMIDFVNRKLLDIYREIDETCSWSYEEWLSKKVMINDILMNGESKISFEINTHKSLDKLKEEVSSIVTDLNYQFEVNLHAREYIKSFIFKYLPKGGEAQAIENNKLTENIVTDYGKYQKGMKLTKVMQREFSSIVSGFVIEEFLKKYSMVVQGAHIRDTLYISTLPEDIITMSDNTNDWSSCMSTDSEYLYRMGIVEYMQSPRVAIAYMKSRTELAPGVDNKKWRALIILTGSYEGGSVRDNNYLIAKIKRPYPYEGKGIVEEIKKYLKLNIDETFVSKEEYLGSRYQTRENFYEAYQDATYDSMHFKVSNPEIIEMLEVRLDYVCPYCGAQGMCPCLDSASMCSICGDYHHDEYMIYVEGFEYICEACFDEEFAFCSDCGEATHYDDLYETENMDYVCEYCADDSYVRCEKCEILVHEDYIEGDVCDTCSREA